jgi:hypothetical protein
MLKRLENIHNVDFTNDHMDRILKSLHNAEEINSSIPHMISGIKIVDDDFEEIISADENHNSLDVCFLIDVYEKRNLPVASNLFLAMKITSENLLRDLSMLPTLLMVSNLNPKFAKYKEEVMKYMLLQ